MDEEMENRGEEPEGRETRGKRQRVIQRSRERLSGRKRQTHSRERKKGQYIQWTDTDGETEDRQIERDREKIKRERRAEETYGKVIKREIQRGSDGKRQKETDGERNRGRNISVKRQRGSQREKTQRGSDRG